jgi:ABC-type lipoprotein export system ATPase subunit
MIVLRSVLKKYNKQVVLGGISLDLEEGQQYVIKGPSGSGKSTLLYLIAGMEYLDGGDIWCCGRHINELNDQDLAWYRNQQVGLIFQFHFLLSTLNNLDNILLPARIAGMGLRGVRSDILDWAKILGVDGLLKKYPYQLSGGEQQRINILRAISLSPRVILGDEPTGSLDQENSKRVMTLLRDISTSLGSTLLVVTHDDLVADGFSNHLYMEDGEIKSI